MLLVGSRTVLLAHPRISLRRNVRLSFPRLVPQQNAAIRRKAAHGTVHLSAFWLVGGVDFRSGLCPAVSNPPAKDGGCSLRAFPGFARHHMERSPMRSTFIDPQTGKSRPSPRRAFFLATKKCRLWTPLNLRVGVARMSRVGSRTPLFGHHDLLRGQWVKLARSVCLFVHFGSLFVPVAPLLVALSDRHYHQSRRKIDPFRNASPTLLLFCPLCAKSGRYCPADMY